MGTISTTPTPNPTLFKRFKKNSLTLLYVLFPDDIDILEKIRNKKMNVCILKEFYRSNINNKIVKMPQISDESFIYLLKMNRSQLLTIDTKSRKLKLWDLISGNLLKTLNSGVYYTSALTKINAKQIAFGYYIKDIYSIIILDIVTDMNCPMYNIINILLIILN